MNVIGLIISLALGVLPSTLPRVEYTAAGGTQFAFSFKTLSTSHVKVYKDGALQSTGYTVALNVGQDSSPGGTVTFLVAPAAGVKVRIERVLPVTQDSVWSSFSKAKSLELDLDRGRMIDQQLVLAYQDALGAATTSAASAAASSAASAGSASAAGAAASAAAASAAAASATATYVRDQRATDLAAQALRDAGQDLALTVPPETPTTAADGRAAFLRLLWTLKSQGGKKVTWVGDSITEQGKTAGQGFTNFIQAAYPGITYSNQGVGGNTTTDVINRLGTITATNADLYVVAVGVNDARYNDTRGATTVDEYIAAMTTIVTALQAGGKSVAVLSIWPTYGKDQYAALGREKTDARFVQWNQALENSCKTTWNVPFIDAAKEIRRVVDYKNVTELAPDGVHPDYDGATYVSTVGARLYGSAVLRSDLPKGEFSPAFVPTGAVFYKLVILKTGTGSDYVSVQNINPAPGPVSEFFAYSANPAVNTANLVGDYNAGAAGFLNKVGDWPATITWSQPSFATNAITAWRGANLGIKNYELYLSTDPQALTDPGHSSWVLKERELTSYGYAHNLLPAKRQKVFYRLQLDDSQGTDGTGGTTGTYVKVLKIWGGTAPVRWTHVNGASVNNLRTDLIFSPSGGADSGTSYFYNAANTYPLHIAWEAEDLLPYLTLASPAGGGAAARGIKNWKLFRSRDPNALTDMAHSTWVRVASGSGDQTVNLETGGFEPLTVNSTAPSVGGGRHYITANTSSTAITDLTDGVDGQDVTIVVNDTNTSFNFVAGAGNLKGNGGVSFAAPRYSVVSCTYSGTLARWHCGIGSAGSISAISVAGNITQGTCISAYGSGTPEGAVTAPVCSTYRRTDGGAGTTFYVKESGTGNTGWVGK